MKNTSRRPKITVTAGGTGIVSQAGGLLLTQALRVTGLDRGLSDGLARWQPGRAVHDPGKIIADLAVTLALGGDCLADAAMLRAEPALFGPVASDPVISRLVTRLADSDRHDRARQPQIARSCRSNGRPLEGADGPGPARTFPWPRIRAAHRQPRSAGDGPHDGRARRYRPAATRDMLIYPFLMCWL